MDNNEKVQLAKGIAKLVVGSSAGSVVSRVIRANVLPTNLLQQAQLVIGSYAIGGIVSAVAVDWADERWDEGVAMVDAIKEVAEKNRKSRLSSV